MKPTKIAIKDGKNSADCYSRKLNKMHFSYVDGRFRKSARSKREIEKAKNFCKSNGLKFYYDNEYGERSQAYRGTYFKVNKPVKHNKYRCVYCGRLFTKDKITVDHIYPVSKVSSNLRLQKKLKRKGIDSLNGAENLVAACWNCNLAKSDKIGIWPLRAKLGKSEVFWRIRKIFRIVIILILMYLLVCLIFPEICPPFLNFLQEARNAVAGVLGKIVI